MKLFYKHKKSSEITHNIMELKAHFMYITNIYSKFQPCKLINLPHSSGIGIITKIPLFKNDHLIIKYTYKGIDFEQEAIVSNVTKDGVLLNFLSFTFPEQENLDKLISASLRKRF